MAKAPSPKLKMVTGLLLARARGALPVVGRALHPGAPNRLLPMPRKDYVHDPERLTKAQSRRARKRVQEIERMIKRVEFLMTQNPAPGTADGRELLRLATTIEEYEKQAYPEVTNQGDNHDSGADLSAGSDRDGTDGGDGQVSPLGGGDPVVHR